MPKSKSLKEMFEELDKDTQEALKAVRIEKNLLRKKPKSRKAWIANSFKVKKRWRAGLKGLKDDYLKIIKDALLVGKDIGVTSRKASEELDRLSKDFDKDITPKDKQDYGKEEKDLKKNVSQKDLEEILGEDFSKLRIRINQAQKEIRDMLKYNDMRRVQEEAKLKAMEEADRKVEGDKREKEDDKNGLLSLVTDDDDDDLLGIIGDDEETPKIEREKEDDKNGLLSLVTDDDNEEKTPEPKRKTEEEIDKQVKANLASYTEKKAHDQAPKTLKKIFRKLENVKKTDGQIIYTEIDLEMRTNHYDQYEDLKWLVKFWELARFFIMYSNDIENSINDSNPEKKLKEVETNVGHMESKLYRLKDELPEEQISIYNEISDVYKILIERVIRAIDTISAEKLVEDVMRKRKENNWEDVKDRCGSAQYVLIKQGIGSTYVVGTKGTGSKLWDAKLENAAKDVTALYYLADLYLTFTKDAEKKLENLDELSEKIVRTESAINEMGSAGYKEWLSKLFQTIKETVDVVKNIFSLIKKAKECLPALLTPLEVKNMNFENLCKGFGNLNSSKSFLESASNFLGRMPRNNELYPESLEKSIKDKLNDSIEKVKSYIEKHTEPSLKEVLKNLIDKDIEESNQLYNSLLQKLGEKELTLKEKEQLIEEFNNALEKTEKNVIDRGTELKKIYTSGRLYFFDEQIKRYTSKVAELKGKVEDQKREIEEAEKRKAEAKNKEEKEEYFAKIKEAELGDFDGAEFEGKKLESEFPEISEVEDDDEPRRFERPEFDENCKKYEELLCKIKKKFNKLKEEVEKTAKGGKSFEESYDKLKKFMLKLSNGRDEDLFGQSKTGEYYKQAFGRLLAIYEDIVNSEGCIQWFKNIEEYAESYEEQHRKNKEWFETYKTKIREFSVLKEKLIREFKKLESDKEGIISKNKLREEKMRMIKAEEDKKLVKAKLSVFAEYVEKIEDCNKNYKERLEDIINQAKKNINDFCRKYFDKNNKPLVDEKGKPLYLEIKTEKRRMTKKYNPKSDGWQSGADQMDFYAFEGPDDSSATEKSDDLEDVEVKINHLEEFIFGRSEENKFFEYKSSIDGMKEVLKLSINDYSQEVKEAFIDEKKLNQKDLEKYEEKRKKLVDLCDAKFKELDSLYSDKKRIWRLQKLIKSY